jgi:hypothetical protein
MHHASVEMTLIERNSSVGIRENKFANQSCEIEHEPTIWTPSEDSPASPAAQPTTILWHQGKAELFGRDPASGTMAVTNVRVVANGGNHPTDVQRVRVPQLHAIIHVGDVVEIGVFDFSQEFTDARMQVGKCGSGEPRFRAQSLL